MSTPLIEARELSKDFPVRGGFLQREIARVHAVDRVSFTVARGETLGLVGESGCGKSTLGRLLVRLIEPDSGTLHVAGRDFLAVDRKALKAERAKIQLIFQDPYASLNPRMSIGRILEEPFKLHGMGSASERQQRVRALLERVGMRPDAMERFPHEFSGGQRQRIGIARAIALEPQIVVCDEPVSALDVSIQSQVLNLLRELQQRLSLTYVFISHDLAVMRYISTRVAVMYLGRLVEVADTDELFANPRHPYTHALLQSLPLPDPTRRGRAVPIEGDVPSPRNPPPGCHFHTRCPHAVERCKRERPELIALSNSGTAPALRGGASFKPDHLVACHLVHSGELPPFAHEHTSRKA